MTDLPREPLDGRAELVVEFGSLSMHSAREDDVHTISLIGELDVATAETVDQELERVEATDAEPIVLDLAGLTFMDSTGVRLVMAAYARSRAETDRLALLRGPQQVQRVFELCGVDGLLPFAD
jgi:stage II sporulation protein AA (anti-sigma F factor antagonist)